MSPDWTQIDIRTPRLLLRPFSSMDADDAFSCITVSLTRFMSWEPPASRPDFDDVWQAWVAAMRDGSEFVFAIRHGVDGQFLGLAGLHQAQAASPELGIWIREDRHGHAYGLEAVAAMADWATRVLKPTSYLYPVAEDNRPSRRIAESLGGVVIEQRATPKYLCVIYRILPARQA